MFQVRTICLHLPAICLQERQNCRKCHNFSIMLPWSCGKSQGCYTEGPRFKPYPGLIIYSYFLWSFLKIFQVFKNQNLPKKLFLLEMNLDFTNVRSEMPPFRVMAISFDKFWSWTSCTGCVGKKLTSLLTFYLVAMLTFSLHTL